MGFGGSNVHVVLDDAYHFLLDHKMAGNHNTVIHPPTREEMTVQSEKSSSCHTFNVSRHHNNCALELKSRLLVWSASDKNSLQRSIASCVQHCQTLASKLDAVDAEEYLSDLAYTLSNRRSSFPWKSFLAVESLKDLSQVEMTPPSATLSMSTPPRIGLVFTGQGAQWFGMGQELRTYPVFHDSLARSAKVLHELGCEWDLLCTYFGHATVIIGSPFANRTFQMSCMKHLGPVLICQSSVSLCARQYNSHWWILSTALTSWLLLS
jgi:acyl transferase domain-containing protein